MYLKRAITASPSELAFPDEQGKMLPRYTALEHVLRIRPRDLEEFIASSVTTPEKRRADRRKSSE